MPYFSKYHLREQRADALLGPMHATLRDLEQRARHFTERLHVSEADAGTLREAHQALAGAREEIERLYRRAAEESARALQAQPNSSQTSTGSGAR